MSSNDHIDVLVLDAHKLFIAGLASIFEDYEDINIVAQATNTSQALNFCKQHKPDIIIMDLVLPNQDSLSFIESVSTRYPKISIIILTRIGHSIPAKAAIQAGAQSYLLKDITPEELANAARSTDAGETVLDQSVINSIMQDDLQQKTYHLTEREFEILSLLPDGLSNKEIANQLTISPSTVRHHVSNILSKLQAVSRVEAVAIAIREDLVT